MSETKKQSEILHSGLTIKRLVLGCLLSGAIAVTSGCGGGGGSGGEPATSPDQTPTTDQTNSAGDVGGTAPKPSDGTSDSGAAPSGGTGSTPSDGQVQVQGSAKLSWAAPVQRVDGSAMSSTDLGGYRIYYGPSSNPTANVVEVSEPSTTQYTINGLSPATYSFSVTAIDSNGRESALSNSLSKTIN